MDEKNNRFLIGFNYWPRETAMYWWRRFDSSTVRRDFSLMAGYRTDVVRIFLLWEDFQPEIGRVSVKALTHLVEVADTADDAEIQILPSFFTGHMRGVNWLPPWMLESFGGEERFLIFSRGEIQRGSIRNMYTDREVWKGQRLLIRETTSALQGHPAVWGWDLGNEPSNLVVPPSRDAARAWLEEMVTELKRWDEHLPVTLGLHQADLEEDRFLGPQEAARFCEILSMHAYSGYSTWADGPLDEKVPLFLGLLTQWLGGKDVLVEEVGVPTEPSPGSLNKVKREKMGRIFLASEEAAESYLRKVLELLSANGLWGALVWCFSDYDPALWDSPPFDDQVHERFFGLLRSDGSPKAAMNVIHDCPRQKRPTALSWDWIDIERREYYERPLEHLEHLYRNFRDRLQEV